MPQQLLDNPIAKNFIYFLAGIFGSFVSPELRYHNVKIIPHRTQDMETGRGDIIPGFLTGYEIVISPEHNSFERAWENRRITFFIPIDIINNTRAAYENKKRFGDLV